MGTYNPDDILERQAQAFESKIILEDIELPYTPGTIVNGLYVPSTSEVLFGPNYNWLCRLVDPQKESRITGKDISETMYG
jgi:hypothetical protein